MQMAQPETSLHSALMADDSRGVLVLGRAIEDCNPRACGLWGDEFSELIGKTLPELSPEVQPGGTPSRKHLTARIQAAQSGLPQAFEWQFRRANGELFDTLVSLESVEMDGRRLVCRVRDLSTLQQAESALRESETRLQQILNNATAMVYVKDRDGHYLLVNRQFERQFHIREAEILGRRDYHVFPREMAETFRRNDLQVVATVKALEFEETVLLADGEHIYLSSKFPLFNTEGEAYAVCGISTDITERKRIEEALRNVALGVSGAIGSDIFKEIVRYLTMALEVDCAYIGKLVEEPNECIHTLAVYDHGKLQENIEYDLKGTPCENVVGKQFEYMPSGASADFPGDPLLQELHFDSYAAYPLFDSQGGALGLIAVMDRKPLRDRDLTEALLKIFSVRAAAELERLRTDEARRISEESYRAIFEASEDALFIQDIDTGTIVDVNPRACEICGYSYQEMKGMDVGMLSSGEHPYTLEEAAKLIEQAKAGRPLRFEWHRKNKDGSLHWDEVVLKRATIAGVDRILAFIREITERKQAEAERVRLEAQLYQAQRMEAIGHLAGGIAHDFNNILTGVMGYVVLAAERAEQIGDEKLNKYLDRAYRSGERARDLIQQMLTFSRGQRGEPRPLSLGPLIKESFKLLGSTLPSTLECHIQIAGETPPVMLDPVQVEQVLMNLCINARDAMGGSGRIEVGLGSVAHHNAVCTSCHQTFTGSFVEMAVRDTGPGISRENLERIFEPFFTTKETGKGSGMGLSTVHGIVHEYGGHIIVHTAAGRGTEFQVLFRPLVSARAQSTPSSPATITVFEKTPALRGRVLVVDDDEVAGDFMEDLLEDWGLEVRLSKNPLEARDLFTQDPQHFDLVVLDQTMPRMTGLELAGQLLALRPDLPVILYTGYSEDLSEEQITSVGVRALIKKPVDTDKLHRLIEDLLSA